MDHSTLANMVIDKTFRDLSKPQGVDLSQGNVNNKNSLGILAMETLEILVENAKSDFIKATTIADVETTLQTPLEIPSWTEEAARFELFQKVYTILRKYLPTV